MQGPRQVSRVRAGTPVSLIDDRLQPDPDVRVYKPRWRHEVPWRSPLAPFRSGWLHRGLIARLGRREIEARYRASMLGFAWAFIVPAAMVAVYTFIFAVVLQARWSGLGEGTTSFAVFLLSGLILHQYFAECVGRAPGLVVENQNYVTKVVFPLEILPWVAVLVPFLGAAIGFGLLVTLRVLTIGLPAPTILLAPLPFLLLLPMVLGLAWGLAAIGVFVRDLGQAIPVILQAMLFLGPVLYPISVVPAPFATLLYVNPVTVPIELMRALLIGGDVNFVHIAIYALAALFVCWFGYAGFIRLKGAFADVL